MKNVLYIQPLHPGGMDRLREKYRVTVAESTDRQTLLAAIADADAVVTRLTAIDGGLIAAAPRLRAIAKHGVGVDNIDMAAANARGIAVLTTGDANSLSVAEHTVAAMAALCKRAAYLDRSVRRGHWLSRDEAGSVDLFRRRLGVVGYGRIGHRVAEMAALGFHMEVGVFSPHADPEELAAAGLSHFDDLDGLCRWADILTLHVPLKEDTRDLMDARRLALLKPSAFLINFARGGVVDEEALYRALTEKRLAGAALDCYAHEPPDPTQPLFQLNNVLLSPHCATFTEDSRIRMSEVLAEGIDDVFRGRRPRWAANPEALKL